MTDELLVNTRSGVVHKPECEVVARTNGRSGPWLTKWKGVAVTDHDRPCGYCLPDGLPAPSTTNVLPEFLDPDAFLPRGTRVVKKQGHRFAGTVAGYVQKRNGEVRVVVEHDEEWLFIFAPGDVRRA